MKASSFAPVAAAGARRNILAFWVGCAIVTVGVLLHIPMYLMGADMGYRLAGMAMDAGMYAGMGLILVGVALASWGLLPARLPESERVYENFAPPADAPLTRAHWMMAALLALALIIDIMKPASLGFVTPGMRREYGLTGAMGAMLPLAALTGTTIGSYLWGWLADIYGRRAAILLSSVIFVGTSICGAMPSFYWNVGMCFLMGLGAGGMLPVAYALLAEIMPTRHRGWMLVLVGGIGAVGGYFAASSLSAALQPEFGWRIMWFLNLPTGLILVALSPFLPESARFLQSVGRAAEARAMFARFGAVVSDGAPAAAPAKKGPINRRYIPLTTALTLAGFAWSLVNFGLLLWLPDALVAEGRSVGAASALIAQSTLISMPVIAVSTLLYSRWSTKGSLLLMMSAMAVGLAAFALRGVAFLPAEPLFALSLVVIGSSGVIAIILPYTTENYPLAFRGRATGWVAASSKFGGLAAQGLTVAGAAPAFAPAAAGVGVLALIAAAMVARTGRETRGRDLSEIDNG